MTEESTVRLSKERGEDFTLTLMNYAAERFLYRLSQSRLREQFVLKGAMLFAVRIGERYRPTRDLDLLGMGEASEVAIHAAVREIAATAVDDDGLVFDVDTPEVHAIREDDRFGGIRAIMRAHLAEVLRSRLSIHIDRDCATSPIGAGARAGMVEQCSILSIDAEHSRFPSIAIGVTRMPP